VPSERSFSILKLLQNKLRSRLTAERINKLQYIYINERVLKRVANASLRKEKTLQHAAEPTEEELQVEIEDGLMAEGEDITTNPVINSDVDPVTSSVILDNDE
jgi:hypothetical protein